MTQKLVKLKQKLLTMILIVSILLHKYLTEKLTTENFSAKLAQANLATKADIADFIKKTDFDDKPRK